MPVYMLLVEGDCDQIVETKAIANRERRDLIDLGCDNVKIREFPSWEAAEAYESKLRGW
jgi:hypothetical protein